MSTVKFLGSRRLQNTSNTCPLVS